MTPDATTPNTPSPNAAQGGASDLTTLRVAEDSEREQLKMWADQVEVDDAYGG